MTFNWKTVLTTALAFFVKEGPTVVADVEKVHGGASEETKTQLAAEALVDGSKVLDQLEPNDSEAIDAVTAVAHGIVTSIKEPSPIAPAVPKHSFALAISPGVGSTNRGGTIMFSTAAYDPRKKIVWSVKTLASDESGSGGGSIEQNGFYTAGPRVGVDIIEAVTADGTAKGTGEAHVQG
jgi:hypothetical protein